MIKYEFIKLSLNGFDAFMYPDSYEIYKNYPSFKKAEKTLVTFVNVHIGCFPLMFTMRDILEDNPNAIIIEERSL